MRSCSCPHFFSPNLPAISPSHSELLSSLTYHMPAPKPSISTFPGWARGVNFLFSTLPFGMWNAAPIKDEYQRDELGCKVHIACPYLNLAVELACTSGLGCIFFFLNGKRKWNLSLLTKLYKNLWCWTHDPTAYYRLGCVDYCKGSTVGVTVTVSEIMVLHNGGIL